jgi:hypothetical protein
MSDFPPPIPNGKNRFKDLARASWIAPLLAAVIGIVTTIGQVGNRSAPNKVQMVVGPLLILAGLIFGITGLFGMRKFGRRGILLPALVGISINLLLIVLAGLPFLLRPHRARLQPALHKASANQLTDDRLKFKLDIPEGFTEFPEGKQMQKADHVYLKRNGGEVMVFSVAGLRGILPRKRLQPAELHGDATITNFTWRGLNVDGTVVREKTPGGSFVTLNAQLPTVPQALQITVGGPEIRRAEVDRVLAELLPTLDAQSSW